MSKNRHVEEGFNLDLTYITPRVIAMAFPAEGIESMFRNQLCDVAALLDRNHPNKYLIINASNRKYNYEKFGNRVIDMNWPNHYPCPFGHFLTVLKASLQYLLEDQANVVVVHCLAGKGRTGSFINALHYATGQFKSMSDANFFYKLKRNVNVTYPSQLKYMDYFVDFFHNGLAHMTFVGQSVEYVELRTANKPFLVGAYAVKVSDFAKDRNLGSAKFDSAVINEPLPGSGSNKYWVETEMDDWEDHYASDILVKLLNPGFFSDGRLFRLNFSVLFSTGNLMVFTPKDVDKANGLPDDFEFILHLSKLPEDEKSAERRQMFESLRMDFEDLKLEMEQRKIRKSLFRNMEIEN
jgi:phosphatidylinositol-3,4,5-trisphosphate 3-phosphatase/dual-specificity protein phosphatase PTEN